MQKLTQPLIDALPVDGHDRIIFDQGQRGFGVRVTAAGRKLYVARARVGGRRLMVTVGYHPEKTLRQAREEALQILADIRQGKDPAAERKARTAVAAATVMTVNALADKWMADYVRPKLKPRTVFDYERLLSRHILPALGHLSVAGIGRDDITKLHVSMARIPRRANYTVSTIRALMNFGIDLGLRPPASNPAARIKMYREYARERFLSEAEIGKAADAIAQAERTGRIGPHAAAGLRLALFTGARSGEITAVMWKYVDWERRQIRLPDSKTNEPRTIHLSDAALEVLQTVPRIGSYVIAGADRYRPYRNLSRAWTVAREFGGLEDVRLHDLRHSYASLAAGRGVSLQMIGKLLGHRVAATTQRYAHLARDTVAAVNDELGAAMAAAIEKGAAPAAPNIVKLKRRRK
jgi:integrase